MKFKITPEGAILTVKYSLQLIVCWPPPFNATRKYLILRNIMWCIAIIFPVLCLPAMILNAVTGPSDPAKWTKNISECLSMNITVLKMIICKYQQSRFQVACADMENFVKTAGPREKAMMERYINRCGVFYTIFQITCTVATTAFNLGPLILHHQPLPAQTEYPFEWRDSPKLITVLYIFQAIAIYQIGAGTVLDTQIAMLLWIAGIRFELLSGEFENVRSSKEFQECIEKHQKLIASVHEIIIVARCFALMVILHTIIIIICAGYQFITHQPIGVVLQFFCMFAATCLEVAVYAWPADNLLTASANIGWAAYSSHWVGKSEKLMKGISVVIVRSQKPMRIALDGIMPELNLDFYRRVTHYIYFPIKELRSAKLRVPPRNCIHKFQPEVFFDSLVNIIVGGLTQILRIYKQRIQFVMTSFSYFTTLKAVVE